MKNRKRFALLSHAVIIFALVHITFLILDIFNPMMGFLSSRYSRVVFILFLLSALTLGIWCVVLCRRSARSARKRRAQSAPSSADAESQE